MHLRGYQQRAADAVERDLEQVPATLVSMATGTGKTAVQAHLAVRASLAGWRVVHVSHRDELVAQFARTVRAFAPQIELGFVHKGARELDAPIIAAGVQSLNNVPDPGVRHLVIVDEAHHAHAPSYQAVLGALRRRNPHLRHVGFTATGYRMVAGKVESIVGPVYPRCAFDYPLQNAMDDGWLVPQIVALRVPTNHVIRGSVRTDGDVDLTMEGIDNEARNATIIASYRHFFPQLPPAIAFCASVAHARHLAAGLMEAGVPAAAVWGTMDRELGAEARVNTLRAHEDGTVRVLTTVGLLTEGVDLPHTSVLLMGRPTTSLPLWMQMLGRGTRPGKPMLGVLDFTDTISSRLDLRPAGLEHVANCIRERRGPYEVFRLARKAA